MAENEIAAPASLIERVATAAPKFRPLKVLLWVLTAPFYALGWVLGLLVVACTFALGAIKVGIADARARATRPSGGSA